ncbi:MAG: hypothetical protein ACOC9S_07455 [Planctomycetota bacterium]
MSNQPSDVTRLEPIELTAGAVRDGESDDGVWYKADDAGAELHYRIEPGTLTETGWLAADMMLDGEFLVVFRIALTESETGRTFKLSFGGLNQCSLRVRIPLTLLKQDRWMYRREGGWLKPLCYADAVEPAKVDKMSLMVLRKSGQACRFRIGPFSYSPSEPPALTAPELPRGPLLDEFGQSTLHGWPGRTRDEAELTARLREQAESASRNAWPESFGRWGGAKDIRFEGTGFFRTHHDGDRWWLLDPSGRAFFSSGLNCVRPATWAVCEQLESALTWLPDSDGDYRDARGHLRGKDQVNYLIANFIRVFGPEHWREKWAEITLAQMRQAGFNTVANWSNWRFAQAAGFPYVRPLRFRPQHAGTVFRDFPDVFAKEFAEDAQEYSQQLCETAGDPALVGYFLMNEPQWGFASQTPAEGMLLNTPRCATRKALAETLRGKYGDDKRLAAAWGVPATLAQVAEGPWKHPLTDAARRDLKEFSTQMVGKLFETLTGACRKVDRDHLNLGARYYTTPPDWALAGMGGFDVFSINCYEARPPAEKLEYIESATSRPVMLGEWHFGALDAGLPASGIYRVGTQADRGAAFRNYLEAAAAHPCCVGAHYFTLYDQSALGRFDGENYNIGFLDVCNRPYGSLLSAARESHERLYAVAAGKTPACKLDCDYRERLFL